MDTKRHILSLIVIFLTPLVLYPDVLVLSGGEGPAATHQYTGPLLGTYRKSTEVNSKPVYQLNGRNFYLFHDSDGHWKIDNDNGQSKYNIRSKQLDLLSPPSNAWQYCSKTEGGENGCEIGSAYWKDDELLVLKEPGKLPLSAL